MAARKPKSNVDYSKSQDIKKIPFAEQMITRMKPYLEALTNDLTKGGIEAFDEYIENLPLPGELSDADNLSTGESIDDKLDEIKESVIDNSARERVTAVGASLKIISMLESFLADNERMSRELSKQEKLADDSEARKTESQVAWSKSVDSKLDRNNKAVDDVPEKTSKYIKKNKNKVFKFLGNVFMGLMLFLSKPMRKFLNDLGFGEAFSNIHDIIEKKFPALLPVVDTVNSIYNMLKDFVDYSWEFALETLRSIYELIVYFRHGFGTSEEERVDYWYDRYKAAGLDKAVTNEDYARITNEVEKKYGYSSAFPIVRKARDKALDKIAEERLPAMAASMKERIMEARDKHMVQSVSMSKMDELEAERGSVPIDTNDDGVPDLRATVDRYGHVVVSNIKNNTVYYNQKNEYTH